MSVKTVNLKMTVPKLFLKSNNSVVLEWKYMEVYGILQGYVSKLVSAV